MNFKTTISRLPNDSGKFIAGFEPDLRIASPGRINLIGEHTDYNNGFALPTAIDKKIYFYLKKNGSDNICNIYSKSYDSFLEFDLNTIQKSAQEWENYVLGVIHELKKYTSKLKGFDCIIDSKLPIGAGISSSAALECGLAFGLNKLFDAKLSKQRIIELSRTAEHSFVGTKCGVMDQFASVMSKSGHAILLDCYSLSHTFVPFEIDPYQILLLNTNVSHSLSTSEYNTRINECETGVQLIRSSYPEVDSLRDVSETMLAEFKNKMNPIIYNRCEYIIQENKRVLEASKALKKGKLSIFGDLMYASHMGLQHKYNVSCDELDFLVEFSKKHIAVLGSRMMGGGFGGCTINLIHQDMTATYIKEVSNAYNQEFKISLSPIIVQPSDGTSIQNF